MLTIITEKPSQSKNFAVALGGMTGVYNGEQYQIVSARGHLYGFDEDTTVHVPKDVANRYKSWDIGDLPWDETIFTWKRKAIPDTLKERTNITKACKMADEVVIATDNDPTGEGDGIAIEVLIENKITGKKFSRMYFEDESVPEIQNAFKARVVIPNLIEHPQYKMFYFRSRWDYLSMQWTRVATKVSNSDKSIREGRLKSAMVKIVGDQIKAHSEYKKVPFYSNKFRDENGNTYTSANEPLFKTKDEVPKKYKASDVVIDEDVIKKSAPPKLLDLASLSAILASSGYKPKEVLQVYQKMYEDKIVSYPRTEDKCITLEQFNDILPLVDKIAAVVGVDNKLLVNRSPRSTHIKSGMAHGANRPGKAVPNKLSDLDKYGKCAPLIYEILAKNYLSMLGADYEYRHQAGHIKDYPDFKGSVNIPHKLGYKEIFLDDDLDTNVKELGTHAKPFIHEGFPPKPQYPTMKWLMAQLSKYNVGTGATRTSTYADVTNEKSKSPLLSDNKGKISMCECGEISYGLLEGTHIASLELTSRVLEQMKAVADGTANADDFLAEIKTLVTEDIETMKHNAEKKGLVMAEKTFEKKEKYSGVWSKTGKNVSFTRKYCDHRFTDEECEDLLAGKEITLMNVTSNKGNIFSCKGVLDNQEFNGTKYIGFKSTGYINDNGAKGIPKKFCEHTFTTKEYEDLEAGAAIYVEGFVSNKGTIFDARIKWGTGRDGNPGFEFLND